MGQWRSHYICCWRRIECGMDEQWEQCLISKMAVKCKLFPSLRSECICHRLLLSFFPVLPSFFPIFEHELDLLYRVLCSLPFFIFIPELSVFDFYRCKSHRILN